MIRTAVREAMRILGAQFVFGRTIDEALKPRRARAPTGSSYSFDMLGEAAKTLADAERYHAGLRAMRSTAWRKQAGSEGRPASRSSCRRSTRATSSRTVTSVEAAVADRVASLALRHHAADIDFTIDAEEADRLELSLDDLRGARSPTTSCSPTAGKRLRPRRAGLPEARRRRCRLARRDRAQRTAGG